MVLEDARKRFHSGWTSFVCTICHRKFSYVSMMFSNFIENGLCMQYNIELLNNNINSRSVNLKFKRGSLALKDVPFMCKNFETKQAFRSTDSKDSLARVDDRKSLPSSVCNVEHPVISTTTKIDGNPLIQLIGCPGRTRVSTHSTFRTTMTNKL